jgi:hypothetical protein
MSSLTFELACADDDPGLRRLLRENPVQGSIALSFEREPNYFNAASVEGSFHQTLVAREPGTAEIIGVGNRSLRPMFINGTVQEIGYMSQLRIHPKYGKGLYLARGLAQGFKLYHALHMDGRTPFYLMSIIEDNLPARRLLTSGLPEYPHVQEYRRMFTYAIYPVRRKRALSLPRSLGLVRGGDKYANGIVDCLNRNNVHKQFASYSTCHSLFTANLTPSDFFLALDGENVAGCIACWDQNAFKQAVVRGYSGGIARWRKLLNAFSRFGSWPYLPEPNTLLRHSYASHLAIDNEDPIVFAVLLRALYNHTLEHGYSYFVIGLAESNPLRSVVEAYRPFTYISQLYLVSWDDGLDAIAKVDPHRIPALEIAML